MSRLSRLKWHNWEQSAIYQYLIALWPYILSQDPSPSVELSDLIDCTEDVVKDFEPFLSIWQSHPSINSLFHLADFVQSGFDYKQGYITSIYLSDEGIGKFLNWVTKPSIIKKLVRSAMKDLEDEDAQELAIALDILKTWNSSTPKVLNKF